MKRTYLIIFRNDEQVYYAGYGGGNDETVDLKELKDKIGSSYDDEKVYSIIRLVARPPWNKDSLEIAEYGFSQGNIYPWSNPKQFPLERKVANLFRQIANDALNSE